MSSCLFSFHTVSFHFAMHPYAWCFSRAGRRPMFRLVVVPSVSFRFVRFRSALFPFRSAAASLFRFAMPRSVSRYFRFTFAFFRFVSFRFAMFLLDSRCFRFDFRLHPYPFRFALFRFVPFRSVSFRFGSFRAGSSFHPLFVIPAERGPGG